VPGAEGASTLSQVAGLEGVDACRWCERADWTVSIRKEWKKNRMDQEYQIVYVDKPEESAWGIIGQSIDQYNAQQAGDYRSQRICFVLQSADQGIVGGIVGAVFWDWFCIDLLWVKEELRGHGYGHRLLTRAEEEARQRGATSAFLDTFSFQAPDFYRQHGYQVFGELRDFPPGHQRYYLTKRL
jgi:GNAT superfamily N-acetyltransferase